MFLMILNVTLPTLRAAGFIPGAQQKLTAAQRSNESPPLLVDNQSHPSVKASVTRKIPELQLIPFAGDITHYASFIKSFQLNFAELPISAAEKLQHLKAALKEEPYKIVSKLDLNDDNYELALKILEETYKNSSMVMSELYHKINSLKLAENTPVSLRKTYYELEGFLIALQTYGQNIDSILPLRDQILCKYPLHITQQVCGTDIPTIFEFQKNMTRYTSIHISIQAAIDAADIPLNVPDLTN